MPPQKQNPIRRAAAEFYDEPQEPEFFVPVGQGRTAFGRYISPALAASDRLMMDDLKGKRDEQETKSAENFTRRLELGSRNRTLPVTEAADIAQKTLMRDKAVSGIRLNPSEEQEALEETQLRREQAVGQRRALPSAQKLQQLQTDDKIEAYESGEQDVQANKIDPLAYGYSLRSIQAANPKLDRKEMQRQARNAALRLHHDQPYVETIEEASLQSGDPRFRAKFLEDVVDPETGARFTRIKADANPAEVASLHRKHTYDRGRAAQQMAERKEKATSSQQQATILDKLADGVRAQIKTIESGAGDRNELPDLKKKLTGFESRLEKMLTEDAVSMDDTDLAKPGK